MRMDASEVRERAARPPTLGSHCGRATARPPKPLAKAETERGSWGPASERVGATAGAKPPGLRKETRA